MNKAALKILILIGMADYSFAAVSKPLSRESSSYAFPKKIKTQPLPSSKDDEITTFDDEDDYDEERLFLIVQADKSSNRPTKPIKRKHKIRSKYFRADIAPQYAYMIMHSHATKNYKGNLGGITGEIEYKKREHVYANASFLWNQGVLKANGHQSREWQEATVQGLIGYTVGISAHMSTTPYVGFGYRKVMDHQRLLILDDRSTVNYYQYFVPFGFLTDYCFNKRFTLSLNLKAMPPVDSRLYATNTPGQFWKLKNKGSYEVELPFKWTAAITKYVDFDMTLNPFFKYWIIGPSPQLHMHTRTQGYWGVELQLGFSL